MKNLTLKYSATQFTYWASATGASAFATVYLLGRGISSGAAGAMLAVSGVLSCAAQPTLASAVDRSERAELGGVLVGLSVLCSLCFGALLLPGMPLPAAGLCYMAGIFCSNIMQPLLNALSVACSRAGYGVNYGAARAIGSAASALATLILGHMIARMGLGSLIVFVLALRLLNIASLIGYPKLTGAGAMRQKGKGKTAFITRYRWYCLSLLGIALLGMFHAMTENYLIAIVQPYGGDSSHVGVAIFIASFTAAPVIFCFGAIRKRIKDTVLLKAAAISFLIKAIGFCLVESVGAVYALQLLQMTSYAFLAPAQVEYAGASVRPEDMVKGQAWMAAAYALGCSAGNFAGGQLLRAGVDAMLAAGVLMAAMGAAILFLTVDRRDAACCSCSAELEN